MNDNTLETFMHRQVECWNQGDKDGFINCYREAAQKGLSIEYIGLPKNDPWIMLESMWQAQASITIDVQACTILGHEGACHHINKLNDGTVSTETLEFYTLIDGKLESRIFIKKPN
ncbi:nuclear transport factor 2 family protein [Halioxenophilus aromaticivorans]